MRAGKPERRRVTVWNHVRAIALLPVMNVIVIPTVILLITSNLNVAWFLHGSASQRLLGTIGVLTLVSGISLVARSIAVFIRTGHGTLAPWDPTQELVVGDVYRYSRNPMKAGLFLVLIGESVSLHSMALACWAAFFMLANVVYIRLSEEPGLRARFGSSYSDYCASVPRWWPRLSHRQASAHRGTRM